MRDRAAASRSEAQATKEAAEAARNLGAIAYLNNTAKAIEAYRTATELDPNDTWSWIYLGLLHQQAGDLAAAERAFERASAAAEASDVERDASVARAYLGDVRFARGDLDGAFKSYKEALATQTKLARQGPGNALWQRDLSVSFNKIGDVQSAKGDLDGALKAYQNSLAIAQKLAAQDPGNAGWQCGLSVGFNEDRRRAEREGRSRRRR